MHNTSEEYCPSCGDVKRLIGTAYDYEITYYCEECGSFVRAEIIEQDNN